MAGRLGETLEPDPLEDGMAIGKVDRRERSITRQKRVDLGEGRR
jgi:hypothetical protein